MHHVADFVAYANGRFGVDSGAYRHAYTFDGITAVGNGESALGLHGFSANENMAEDPAIWDDWTVVGSPAVTLLAAATDNRCCPVHLTGSFDAGFPLVLRQDGLEEETRIFLYESGDQVYPFADPGPDTIPPTAPSGLHSDSVTSDRVVMSWTASTDNRGV